MLSTPYAYPTITTAWLCRQGKYWSVPVCDHRFTIFFPDELFVDDELVFSADFTTSKQLVLRVQPLGGRRIFAHHPEIINYDLHLRPPCPSCEHTSPHHITVAGTISPRQSFGRRCGCGHQWYQEGHCVEPWVFIL